MSGLGTNDRFKRCEQDSPAGKHAGRRFAEYLLRLPAVIKSRGYRDCTLGVQHDEYESSRRDI